MHTEIFRLYVILHNKIESFKICCLYHKFVEVYLYFGNKYKLYNELVIIWLCREWSGAKRYLIDLFRGVVQNIKSADDKTSDDGEVPYVAVYNMQYFFHSQLHTANYKWNCLVVTVVRNLFSLYQLALQFHLIKFSPMTKSLIQILPGKSKLIWVIQLGV